MPRKPANLAWQSNCSPVSPWESAQHIYPSHRTSLFNGAALYLWLIRKIRTNQEQQAMGMGLWHINIRWRVQRQQRRCMTDMLRRRLVTTSSCASLPHCSKELWTPTWDLRISWHDGCARNCLHATRHFGKTSRAPCKNADQPTPHDT